MLPFGTTSSFGFQALCLALIVIIALAVGLTIKSIDKNRKWSQETTWTISMVAGAIIAPFITLLFH